MSIYLQIKFTSEMITHTNRVHLLQSQVHILVDLVPSPSEACCDSISTCPARWKGNINN